MADFRFVGYQPNPDPGWRLVWLDVDNVEVVIQPLVGWIARSDGRDTVVVPAAFDYALLRWVPIEPAPDVRVIGPGESEPTANQVGKWTRLIRKEREAAAAKDEPFHPAAGVEP